MGRVKKDLIGVGILALSLGSCDQQGKFQGVVVDNDTHKPISGAVWVGSNEPFDSNLIVDDSAIKKYSDINTTTGSDGKYFYKTIMPTQAALDFLKTGYRPAFVHLPVDTVYLTRR